MHFLTLLGRDVEIVVKRAPGLAGRAASASLLIPKRRLFKRSAAIFCLRSFRNGLQRLF